MIKSLFLCALVILLTSVNSHAQEFSTEHPQDHSNSKQILLNQIKSETESNLITEANLNITQTKKSTGIAMLLSLVLPGAGHLYLDRMDAGKYFLGIDAINWIGFAGVNIYGDKINSDARSFSVIHAGVSNKDRGKDYFSNVGFYNSIYDYNNDKLARGEFNAIYDVNSYYWFWDSQDNKNQFESQRKKSERMKNTGIIFGTALIVNRLASAVSAIILSNRTNSGSGFGVSSNVLRDNNNSFDGFVINLHKNF